MDTGIQVYFCDPVNPGNEVLTRTPMGCCASTCPEGTDLTVHSQEELDHIARSLNNRPRQTLGWLNPSVKDGSITTNYCNDWLKPPTLLRQGWAQKYRAMAALSPIRPNWDRSHDLGRVTVAAQHLSAPSHLFCAQICAVFHWSRPFRQQSHQNPTQNKRTVHGEGQGQPLPAGGSTPGCTGRRQPPAAVPGPRAPTRLRS